MSRACSAPGMLREVVGAVGCKWGGAAACFGALIYPEVFSGLFPRAERLLAILADRVFQIVRVFQVFNALAQASHLE